MKNRLRLLLGLSLFLIAAPTHAQSPANFIDQMQPLSNNQTGTLAIGGASTQKLAQTVTVGHDGRLRGVFLPIACASGRLVVEIRNVDNDMPGSILLGRRGFAAEDVPGIVSVFRFFNLEETDLSFVTGDRFAIVLRNPTGSCGILRGPIGDSYPGGIGFFDALPNPPGWVPFSSTETRLDLPFMTVMKLP